MKTKSTSRLCGK